MNKSVKSVIVKKTGRPERPPRMGFLKLTKEILEGLHSGNVRSGFVGVLDLEVYLFTIYGYFSGSRDSYLNLISLYFEDGHFDVVIDDQCLSFFTGKCQHL